jgi:hypothetical protein
VITESFWKYHSVTSRTSISWSSAAGLAVTAVLLTGCGGSSNHSQQSADVHSAAPAASPSASARASTQSECEAQPDSSGDILVRVTTNGQPAVTQQVGGQWTWDATTRSCDTAVQSVLAKASSTTGDCTQVALTSANPGYKLTTSPAPPLKKVLATKGPAC